MLPVRSPCVSRLHAAVQQLFQPLLLGLHRHRVMPHCTPPRLLAQRDSVHSQFISLSRVESANDFSSVRNSYTPSFPIPTEVALILPFLCGVLD